MLTQGTVWRKKGPRHMRDRLVGDGGLSLSSGIVLSKRWRW